MAYDERIAKVLGRALRYHGRWEEVRHTRGWILGPTFAVSSNDSTLYGVKATSHDTKQLEAFLALYAEGGFVPVTIDVGNHPRQGYKTPCKRRLVRYDGDLRPQLEVEFSLLTLVRTCFGKGLDVLQRPDSFELYFVKEGQLKAILAGKMIGDNCEISEDQ